MIWTIVLTFWAGSWLFTTIWLGYDHQKEWRAAKTKTKKNKISKDFASTFLMWIILGWIIAPFWALTAVGEKLYDYFNPGGLI